MSKVKGKDKKQPESVVLKVHPGLKVVTYEGKTKLAERELGAMELRLRSSYTYYKISKDYEDRSQEEEWRLYVGETDYGHFRTKIHHTTGNWCMSSSNINDIKGIGIGQWVYTALTMHYGVFESDPYGTTSDEATRVWIKLGASKIPLAGAHKTKQRYRLTAEKLSKKNVKKKGKKK